MKLLSPLLWAVFILIFGCGPAEDRPKLPSGTYKLTRMVNEDLPFNHDIALTERHVISGHTFNAYPTQTGDKPEYTTYKIDPTTTPAGIDFFGWAEEKTVVRLGIFQLEGNMIRICVSLSDKPQRPTSFIPSRDNHEILYEFQKCD